MPEELTAKNKIEILSVLYGPYECTALFVSGITSSIGKKECEAMQKAIASALATPEPPHITPNDADCKGCPERQNQGLVWTKESPKVSGNYWWICGQEQPDEPQMVNVVLSEGRFHFFFHYSEGPFFHECDSCQWAGPIPMPEEHAK